MGVSVRSRASGKPVGADSLVSRRSSMISSRTSSFGARMFLTAFAILHVLLCCAPSSQEQRSFAPSFQLARAQRQRRHAIASFQADPGPKVQGSQLRTDWATGQGLQDRQAVAEVWDHSGDCEKAIGLLGKERPDPLCEVLSGH